MSFSLLVGDNGTIGNDSSLLPSASGFEIKPLQQGEAVRPPEMNNNKDFVPVILGPGQKPSKGKAGPEVTLVHQTQENLSPITVMDDIEQDVTATQLVPTTPPASNSHSSLSGIDFELRSKPTADTIGTGLPSGSSEKESNVVFSHNSSVNKDAGLQETVPDDHNHVPNNNNNNRTNWKDRQVTRHNRAIRLLPIDLGVSA